MKRVLALALILAICAASSAFAADPPSMPIITFSVAAAPPVVSPEGFVDGSNKVLMDSAQDVGKALDTKSFHPLKGYPGTPMTFRYVANPADADITLTIGARGINDVSLGARTTMEFYRGVVLADTVQTFGVTRWVSLILTVGTYRKELITWETNRSRFSAGAWTADAKLLARGVAGWVMANEDRILQRQHDRSINK